ncbi:hypothetical protein HKBW3S25_01688, partial [Candidatus Hakubella thermalkaliphila]
MPLLRKGCLMLVGETPRDTSGRSLDDVLALAGTSRGYVSLTNVFDERPTNNNLDNWGILPKEAHKLLRNAIADGESPEFCQPIFGTTLVVHPSKTIPALKRLKTELIKGNPSCIVALGHTALRALCGVTGIGKARGALHFCSLWPSMPPIKVIPTYHPAILLRAFEN